MSKLKKEELLEKLNKAFEYLPLSIANGQAHRQIKAIITKFSEECVKSFDVGYKAGVIERPRVTEGWIEEKARGMYQTSICFPNNTPKTILYKCKKFIRSLVEEIPIKKLIVTEKFVWEAIEYIAEYSSYNRLEKKLKEAGVEVAEK